MVTTFYLNLFCRAATQPRKAKLAKEVILRSRRRLCNNCTGGPTNLQSCRPQLRQRPRCGGAVAAASATISGYDGRMQAGRSPAAKKQRYITSNDRYKSRAFSLSSTCVPVPKIRHYQGNFALLYCSLNCLHFYCHKLRVWQPHGTMPAAAEATFKGSFS